MHNYAPNPGLLPSALTIVSAGLLPSAGGYNSRLLKVLASRSQGSPALRRPGGSSRCPGRHLRDARLRAVRRRRLLARPAKLLASPKYECLHAFFSLLQCDMREDIKGFTNDFAFFAT